MSQHQLAELYLDVFNNIIGSPVAIDSHGNIVGELTGMTVKFVVDIDPTDPAYLKLLVPFSIDDDPDIIAAALTGVNTTMPGVNVVPIGDRRYQCTVKTMVAVPGHAPSRAHLAAVLPQSLDMMGCAMVALMKRMHSASK